MQNSTVTRRGFLRTASTIASTGALLRIVILLAVVGGFLAVCGRASAQIFAPSSSSAASADRSVWGQAIGVTSIILCKVPNCSAPEGTPEVILFSGLLEITKS